MGKKILKGKIRFPKYFSKESRNLIVKLLQHRPTKRLGVLKGGAENIRKHIWFKNFKWDKLRSQGIKPPIVNKVKNAHDLNSFKSQQHIKDSVAQPIDPKDEFDETFFLLFCYIIIVLFCLCLS